MADLVVTATSVVAGSDSVQEAGICGETIAAGKCVAQGTDNLWYLADSNSATAAIRQCKGIALNGGAVGQPLRIHRQGDITIGATLTLGLAYYLSDTPGGICPVADVTAGEYVNVLGVAKSTTVLALAIQFPGIAI